MKRLTGYLLLTLHLMAFTECHQLLRLPFFMQHFQQHCTADSMMNLEKFLKIHYFSPGSVTDDYNQDQQLPFRGGDCHLLNTTAYVYEPVSIQIKPISAVSAVFYCYNETSVPQFSSFDIFQPPKENTLL